MTVVVVLVRLVVDEIREVHDALDTEVVVPRRHARVDDRDPDPRPVEPQVLLHPGGAHGGAGPLHRPADLAVEAKRLDLRAVRQRVERSVRDLCDLRVVQLASGLAAERLDQRVGRRAVGLDDDAGSPTWRVGALLQEGVQLPVAGVVRRNRRHREGGQKPDGGESSVLHFAGSLP
jgi:hypothetical protein